MRSETALNQARPIPEETQVTDVWGKDPVNCNLVSNGGSISFFGKSQPEGRDTFASRPLEETGARKRLSSREFAKRLILFS